MNEPSRSDSLLAAVEEEQRLSSGKLVEPSSHFRMPDPTDRTYSGSDTFDFGSRSHTSSPMKQQHNAIDEGERRITVEDYLNGGQPHEDIAPIHIPNHENGAAAVPLSSSASTPRLAPAPMIVTDPSSAAEPNGFTAEPAEMSTPVVGRRSVQFARNDTVLNDLQPPPSLSQTNSHARNSSWDARDAIGKIRSSAFMAKLKELAVPGTYGGHGQGHDALGVGSSTSSPTVTRQSTRVQGTRDVDENEGSDADADAEETADEGPTGPGIGPVGAGAKSKKKRRMRRPRDILSTPTTPRFASQGGDPDTPIQHSRLNFIRRATIADASDQRAGFSEGEGRDRFDSERGMFRTGSWGLHHVDTPDGGESPSRSRMGHFRRISAFAGRGGAVGDGGMSDGGGLTPRASRPFFGGERASTFGAQKWQQVKRTLKALRKQKVEHIDYLKSAELMAELRAGAPAVMMLASMIQRDEHGNKRIPVLLEQLKLKIRDSQPVQGDSERHWLFTIDLEYGSGPSRMKWTVKRTIREIMNMHWKYKLALKNEKYLTNQLNLGSNRPKQPSFPLSAFPYLRGARGLEDDEDEPQAGGGEDTAGEATAAEMTAAEGTATEGEGRPRPKKKRSRMNVLGGRRKSSGLLDMNASNADLSQLDAAAARRRYVERQQRMLEKYLTEMVHWLMFRADSNRLCRFLELSALGVRLAAEGSYHGKECYMHIQSSKGLDFRRVVTPQRVFARHTRKWFLVRQSYIVCVESPENMNIYDVYLVDPKFKIITKKSKLKQITSTNNNTEPIDLTKDPAPEKHHTLKILTSERKVTLFSRNQHIVRQFEESITEMLRATPWAIRNRFGSFAPVRTGVHAQWLVDGRDYMWNVSRAINMARDVIYIHDWWLTPELYMRRPACISQKWRLDRLLQKKAKEGVKIFIIIYRNVEAAVPIDSEYTKFSLLNLHPNIFVQRSPNQLKKNQFFFAHHEKICVVDHDVAFVGGIDLCFGRWDCPQHPIADDKPTGFENGEDPKDAEHCQLFPGKDYSNPRVQDFFRLTEPYEEMYDRSRVPRMPWHDISMQVVGQPARDLTRHFVQRWNYVRRGRKPTRPTPFLLPPPDYKKEDLEALGLTGTCEVQILRSACAWSLGIDETESSIQSAYVKMIEDSEHFVYMENQFFITSTETLNNKMVNRIGDALVERAIRAHENGEDWRAVILIPLMPGFQNEVNEQDGTSVRLILQCQYRSICRGDTSIFGRLKAAGISHPEDYIEFFSLRQWGKIGNNLLTTEQLYIHAKVIVVDDRVALIGSANINERSMLGNRDSECAAIVRDTDMLWSTMGGKPYRVGRFAHTLRLRLMREHLGLDVDEILEEERQADMGSREDFESEMDRIYNEESDESDDEPPHVGGSGRSSRLSRSRERRDRPPMETRSSSFNRDVDLIDSYDGSRPSSSRRGRARGKSLDPRDRPENDRGVGGEKHQKEVAGYGPDQWKSAEQHGLDEGRDSVMINGHEVLIHDILPEGRGTLDHPKLSTSPKKPGSTAASAADEGMGNSGMPTMPAFDRRTTEQLGLPRANQLPELPAADDTDIGGPPLTIDATGKQVADLKLNPLTADIELARIDKDCMRDPLNPSFYEDVWYRAASNNTKLYRRVFRCMPDSDVTNWAEYKEYKAYGQRFKESMEGGARSSDDQHGKGPDVPAKQASTGGGIGAPGPATVAKVLAEKATGGAFKAGGNEGPTVAGHHMSLPHLHSEKEALSDANLPESNPVGGNEAIADPEKRAAAEADDAEAAPRPDSANDNHLSIPSSKPLEKQRRTTFSDPEKPPTTAESGVSSTTAFPSPQQPTTSTSSPYPPTNSEKQQQQTPQKRRRRATTRGSRREGFRGATDEILRREEAEELMNLMQGTLVQFPYDWLAVEEGNGNWLFQVDQVAPLQIYN